MYLALLHTHYAHTYTLHTPAHHKQRQIMVIKTHSSSVNGMLVANAINNWEGKCVLTSTFVLYIHDGLQWFEFKLIELGMFATCALSTHENTLHLTGLNFSLHSPALNPHIHVQTQVCTCICTCMLTGVYVFIVVFCISGWMGSNIQRTRGWGGKKKAVYCNLHRSSWTPVYCIAGSLWGEPVKL